ncbi:MULTISPECIES: sigma-70 family RNA polymerase sigma factor [Cohnella]|uniref:sigma-70 family RNA polymerase sigma factor n=1 Tax=Cohnella TaxID=329857 RepID=UPI0009BA02BA|nr:MULTISPECIES: sigma-70 family RNA polymerase sigma factor [Cohnella]MBN2984955.1 sigma-70 family RNA polymerase sigma factor [Cohnella algarum]
MPEYEHLEDVKRARRGDNEAFSKLVKEMQTDLYRMARSFMENDADCADAIQEAILSAYRGLPKLKEPAYFRTWMFRILLRECHRMRRRIKITVPWTEALAGKEYGNVREPEIDLYVAVRQLDESLQTVVRLHYFMDLPLGEIAKVMDVPEGTLKSRLHRARRLLAKWLRGPEENAPAGEVPGGSALEK